MSRRLRPKSVDIAKCIETHLFVLSFKAVSINADLLCVKKSLYPSGRKLALSSAIKIASSRCPSGYATVLDTNTFRGDSGERGPTGPIGLRGEQGSKGDAGPQGIQGFPGTLGDKGDQGGKGDTGERGSSAFDTIPSGTTVRGVITAQGVAFERVAVSFQAPIPKAILFDDVIRATTAALTAACVDITKCLDATEIDKDFTQCTGSAESPTAPAGTVCIYPITWSIVNGNSPTSSHPFEGISSLYGFQLTPSMGHQSRFEAVWAYTAPF